MAALPTIGAIPSQSTSHALVFPTDAYQLTAEQQHSVLAAVDALVTSCMHRYGFTDFIRSAGAVGTDAFGTDRLYGVSDPAIAARYGYHLTAQQAAEVDKGRAGVTAEQQTSLSAAESTVLGNTRSNSGSEPSGPSTSYAGKAVPLGGCYGEAYRTMGVDRRLDISLPQVLNNSAYDQSEADHRVKAVIATWSECMKNKGYRTPDPLAFSDHWNNADPGVTPTKPEIAAAVADVACKQQTKLVPTWYAVQVAYDNTLIHQYSSQLTLIRRQLDTELRVAAAVH